MPLLTAVDDLPTRPYRVLVNGTSGSGKTTLARRIAASPHRRIAEEIEAPHVEIDALFHGPG